MQRFGWAETSRCVPLPRNSYLPGIETLSKMDKPRRKPTRFICVIKPLIQVSAPWCDRDEVHCMVKGKTQTEFVLYICTYLHGFC